MACDVADVYGMTASRACHHRYDATLLASIDPGGRLSLGRIERRLGMTLERAFVFATPSRLVVRFCDEHSPPPGWVEAPVVRAPGRYPHLRLTGLAVRPLLSRAGVVYPVRVRVTAVIEASQCTVAAVR